jgi:hypothetical protein
VILSSECSGALTCEALLQGKFVSPSVAVPIDDGRVHWGWLGGVASSEDKGLWPQRTSQVCT